jgi:hypothetical protein
MVWESIKAKSSVKRKNTRPKSEQPKAALPADFAAWKRHGVPDYVRLYIEKFRGRLVVHLRIWCANDKGELYPTKRGITVPHEQLAPLRLGLRKVEEQLATDTRRVTERTGRKKS